jgi:hypothetical protein
MVSGYTSSLGNYPGMYSYLHLAKVDSLGDLQWVKNYDGLGDNKALFVEETDDGEYAVAGTTQPPEEAAHYNIWFAKIDSNGDIIPEFHYWDSSILLLAKLIALIFVYWIKIKRISI